VRIDLTIPHRVISVSDGTNLDHAHEDIYVAIADAFRAARRQLLDHRDARREFVTPPAGARDITSL